jgi:plasmid stabilization system protein ParE
VAYLVKITARAERDLALLYEKIDAGGSFAARRWYQGLKGAILGLEDAPYIWPATHEARQLRQVLYGHRPHSVYRVIYRVHEKQKKVEILHIRHGSRRQFKAPDVK